MSETAMNIAILALYGSASASGLLAWASHQRREAPSAIWWDIAHRCSSITALGLAMLCIFGAADLAKCGVPAP